MGTHRKLRLTTFGIGRAVAVIVAFVLFASSARVEAFTLIDIENEFAGRCDSAASQAWNACITTSTCTSGFSGGVGSGGPFFRLSVAYPDPFVYLYTYGDELTKTQAAIEIETEDLSELSKWCSHAMATTQTLYVDLEGPWFVTKPAGVFEGSLEFEFVPPAPPATTCLVCVVPEFQN